jgi:hypothetical protein
MVEWRLMNFRMDHLTTYQTFENSNLEPSRADHRWNALVDTSAMRCWRVSTQIEASIRCIPRTFRSRETHHTSDVGRSQTPNILNPKHSLINGITAPMLQKKKKEEGQCIIKVRRHR